MQGELIDCVEWTTYFPNVDELYAFELKCEDYDNDLGGN